ncbi:hypothetical protein FA95DRAFT_1574780 [Auriscalpium vulgare]|uniref:Uncharacterized protein n=1 Tax=Auriscalpium vulgare TaxID=40419 RepID=A0ACB8RJ80_9AGAM|nr:hypothetical protein FA95DRAFT_1574780 [Auriscalpium vulgare]
MGPTEWDGPSSQRQSLPTSFEPPRTPITPGLPVILNDFDVPQLRTAVRFRRVWPHAPVLSRCQVTKYCPGGRFEYRGFRFKRLLVGEDVDVMYEHSHPLKSRVLEDVDEHEDDTLVLVRKADNIWNPLGWVWESLLQPFTDEVVHEEAAPILSTRPLKSYEAPLERSSAAMDAPWLYDDSSYGQSYESFSTASASHLIRPPTTEQPGSAQPSRKEMFSSTLRAPSISRPHPNAPSSLLATLKNARAPRFKLNGHPQRTTIYGITDHDLSESLSPVGIRFSLDPPNDIPESGYVPKRTTTLTANAASGDVLEDLRPADQQREAKQSMLTRSNSTLIPRANFFPRTPAARPRSRSSGFDNQLVPGGTPKERSREEPVGRDATQPEVNHRASTESGRRASSLSADLMSSGASTLSATSDLDSIVSMKTMISISSYKDRMNQSIQPPGTVNLR